MKLRNIVIILILAISANIKADTKDESITFNKPAANWLEALPIGNGHLGAMVFGSTTTDTLSLNDDTFWSGSPHNNNSSESRSHLQEVRRLIFDGKTKDAEDLINKYFIKGPHGQKYLPLGDLIIDYPSKGTITDYKRQLNLGNALQTIDYKQGNIIFHREILASIPDHLIIVRLTSSKPSSVIIRDINSLKSSRTIDENILKVTVDGVDHEGIKGTLKAQYWVMVKSNGRIKSENYRIHVRKATEITLYITSATNFINYHDVSGHPEITNANNLDLANKYTYEQLKERQQKAYKQQYNRVSMHIDGQNLVNKMFNYSRFLLISSSQPGSEPANLQGIWNRQVDAPWDSKYTININLQMNYWPADICGLYECEEPLWQLIEELSQTGKETARVMYGCRGWMAHHNTDIWRIAGPVDGAFWGMYPNGGAWLTTHIWQHFLFTRDTTFLHRHYPEMREAAEFLLDYMQKDPRTGYKVTVPSVSPEHGPHGKSPITAGCTMDNQIARDVFTQVVLADNILNHATDNIHHTWLKSAIDSIAPMKTGQYGQLQEWPEDADDPKDQHRHISHLYGLYPSNQINPSTPELYAAARQTLIQRGDEATGWSLAWKICFWARLHDGNHAWKIIQNLFNGHLYPNLFDAHPPFQIDGNFGLAAGICEMLLQSQNVVLTNDTSHIQLLPALPDDWKSGEFHNFHARGGYIVSCKWKDGKVIWKERKKEH